MTAKRFRANGRLLGFLCALLPTPSAPAAEVEPVFATPANRDANVDSCAVWVAPDPADSLLFVGVTRAQRALVVSYAETAGGTVRSPRRTRPQLLERWQRRWNDLVDFECVPVLTSAAAAALILEE